MEFEEIVKKSKEVQAAYRIFNAKNGHKKWGSLEYTEGLVGDVGDLMKLMMAKHKIRRGENIDKKLAHELSDCFWSIIIIASELGVDLEKEFFESMAELEKRIK